MTLHYRSEDVTGWIASRFEEGRRVEEGRGGEVNCSNPEGEKKKKKY